MAVDTIFGPVERSYLRLAAIMAAALAAISLFAWWTADRADQQMRVDLLQQAKLVASVVDSGFVATLRGKKEEERQPGFNDLRDRLFRARAANPKCRFLYLLGRDASGSVIFLMDTEPADSQDYSPPGQIYNEAPASVADVFDRGQGATVGPYTDRWGTWVSAFTPLADPATGRPVAVVGLDMNAGAWGWDVAGRSALPVGLASFVVFLGIFIVALNRNHRFIRSQERSIRDSEERYRVFINSTADMVFLKDAGFRYSIVNRRLADFFGRDPEAVKGLTDYDLMDTEAAENCRKGDLQSLESNAITRNEEVVNGRIFETTKFPVSLGKEKVVGGIIRDITERTLAAEEKGVLLRELQHRVKNSLAIITSITELEALKSEDPAVRGTLQTLGGRIHTLSELYSLLYKSGESTRVAFDRYCASISDFVMAAHTSGDGRIVLQKRLSPFDIDARSASAFGLILNELLTNALKYAFPGERPGLVVVSLALEDGDIELRVEDNGIGLPAEFDLGTPRGLGLEMVKMLSRQMGGSVACMRGERTVFSVRAALHAVSGGRDGGGTAEKEEELKRLKETAET